MDKPPLYRRENTTARGSRPRGGEYRHRRNSKRVATSDVAQEGMGRTAGRGRDYTPLFRFLLSRIGSDWDATVTEARARLDRTDPIFWLVAVRESDRRDYVRVGESTYYSGLYVDSEGTLQVVNPDIDASTLDPRCACCTHTFNGARFTRPYPS
ncbi:hypothetical protein [Nocardia huaxiensis]|uniref:Uncharacterized protein n=1 Tax=Nocardia huaxiensis TaxID=2755382 RepID=A0A7D6ZF90_9NOCA|nr:hypothetical protein [Nocardia huaxiensis]QLY28907.1 hypothetical protein H0264_26750 [Nocardia huaxiensis]UFS97618.1 hypothetical protein LPY97_06850 [Nocardia huaxiensis]